ncbi:MAG: hypothetical protein AAGJ74_03895 [Pseudomonadota bacterium]
MRRVTVGDSLAAARVLTVVPLRHQGWVILRLFCEAARADAHRRKTGRCHPVWGDGTLMTAALRRQPPPEPPLENAAFRAALIAVLGHVGYPQADNAQVAVAGSKLRLTAEVPSPDTWQ